MRTATALKFLATAGALSVMMVSSPAKAASCINDVDCPEPACGGQVCDYNKGLTCQPAGGAPKGQDGWCTVDSDCKCMGMGAKCVSVYCTFTTPPAGGSGGASAGSGGSSGTGGATGSGGATSSGGTTGSGGTTSSGSGGTAGPAGSGGSASNPKPNSDGGCSVSGSSPASVIGILFGLSVLGLRRFRRRA